MVGTVLRGCCLRLTVEPLCLVKENVKLYVKNTCGGEEGDSSTHSYPDREVVTGQLYRPYAVPLEKESALSFEREVERTSRQLYLFSGIVVYRSSARYFSVIPTELNPL